MVKAATTTTGVPTGMPTGVPSAGVPTGVPSAGVPATQGPTPNATWAPFASELANATTGATDAQKETTRYVLWFFAGAAAVATVVVSFLLIKKHLQNMTRPREQRKIVGILWLAPIFAVDAFISLTVPASAPFLSVVKDVYEGYTVYLFFSLMVEFLGGEARTVQQIKNRPEPLYRPWPMNYCLRHPLTTNPDGFFFGCKYGVMQFVVVRPLMALVAFFLYLGGVYRKGDFSLDQGFIYVELVINFSVSWAFYCLVLFYLCLKRPLHSYNPFPKFLSIKMVVFLSFWQGVLLALLAETHVITEAGSWGTENVTTGIQNILICFEMLLAAFYHRYAFPWQIYDRGRTNSLSSAGLNENFALSDARRDFAELMPETFVRISPPVLVHASDGDGDEEDGPFAIKGSGGAGGGAGASSGAVEQTQALFDSQQQHHQQQQQPQPKQQRPRNSSSNAQTEFEGEQPLLREGNDSLNLQRT